MTSPAEGPTLDFAEGFRFFFADPEWLKKILIGGAFTLLASLLVGIPFVAGYAVRILRRTARRESPLPEWEDLGGIFQDGIKALGLYLAYFLGLALIPAALGCLMALVGGGLTAAADGSDAQGPLGALLGFGLVATYAIFGLLMLVLLLYFPAAFARFSVLESFGAGFEFRENLSFITRNLGNYALALVLYLITSFLSQFGILLLCIGIFPAAFWSYCVCAWALGQTAKRDSTLSQA